uniref:Uncharacterized protein n=1 Tax=Cacopsylla melanoneura TaxID=428564 RepID=A0A8D8ZR76_9HEMI
MVLILVRNALFPSTVSLTLSLSLPSSPSSQLPTFTPSLTTLPLLFLFSSIPNTVVSVLLTLISSMCSHSFSLMSKSYPSCVSTRIRMISRIRSYRMRCLACSCFPLTHRKTLSCLTGANRSRRRGCLRSCCAGFTISSYACTSTSPCA